MFTNVAHEFEHDSIAAARDAANEDAAQSGGRVFPCTVSSQGGRLMISTAFSMGFIAKHLKIDPAPRGGTPQRNVNRPILVDHVKNIKRYLLENRKDYFLPALCLNIRTMPQIHVARTNAALRSGYLVIGDDTVFDVTDGQHRTGAVAGVPSLKITGVLDEDPSFSSDSVTVQITVESDLERIHQNFADAAQTKPIPPSLLAAFNMREPVNRVLNHIVTRSSLLNERIDETNKTLPKQSQSLFLLNQVRGFVKELLVGDYAIGDDALARITGKRLASKEQQDLFIEQTLQLLEALARVMVPWKDVVALPLHSDRANVIPDFRASYLNMTATGLVLIGHAAFEINRLGLADEDRLAKYADIGTRINWARKAPIWNGNVIIADPNPNKQGSLKVLTARLPVRLAEKAIREALALPATLETENDAETEASDVPVQEAWA